MRRAGSARASAGATQPRVDDMSVAPLRVSPSRGASVQRVHSEILQSEGGSGRNSPAGRATAVSLGAPSTMGDLSKQFLDMRDDPALKLHSVVLTQEEITKEVERLWGMVERQRGVMSDKEEEMKTMGVMLRGTAARERKKVLSETEHLRQRAVDVVRHAEHKMTEAQAEVARMQADMRAQADEYNALEEKYRLAIQVQRDAAHDREGVEAALRKEVAQAEASARLIHAKNSEAVLLLKEEIARLRGKHSTLHARLKSQDEALATTETVLAEERRQRTKAEQAAQRLMDDILAAREEANSAQTAKEDAQRDAAAANRKAERAADTIARLEREVETSEADARRVAETVTAARGRVLEVEQENEELFKRVQETKEARDELQAVVDAMHSERATLDETIATLEADAARGRKDHQATSAQLQEATDDVARLRGDLERHDEARKQQLLDIQTLRAEAAQAEQAAHDAAVRLDASTAELTGTKSRLDASQAKCATLADEIAALTADLSRAAGERDAERAKHAAAVEELSFQQAELGRLKVERDGLARDRQALSASLSTATEELATRRSETDVLKGEQQTASAELLRLRDDVQRLSAEAHQAATAMRDAHTEAARCAGDAEQARREAASATEDLSRATTDAARRAAEANEARDTAAALQEELAALKVEALQRGSELSTSQTRCATLEEQVVFLKGEMARVTGESQEVLVRLNNTVTALARLEGEHAVLHVSHSNTTGQLQMVTADLAQQKQAHDASHAEVQRLSAELATASAALATCRTELQGTAERLRVVEETHAQTTAEFAVAQGSVASLTKELTDARGELAEVSASYMDASEKATLLPAAQAEVDRLTAAVEAGRAAAGVLTAEVATITCELEHEKQLRAQGEVDFAELEGSLRGRVARLVSALVRAREVLLMRRFFGVLATHASRRGAAAAHARVVSTLTSSRAAQREKAARWSASDARVRMLHRAWLRLAVHAAQRVAGRSAAQVATLREEQQELTERAARLTAELRTTALQAQAREHDLSAKLASSASQLEQAQQDVYQANVKAQSADYRNRRYRKELAGALADRTHRVHMLRYYTAMAVNVQAQRTRQLERTLSSKTVEWDQRLVGALNSMAAVEQLNVQLAALEEVGRVRRLQVDQLTGHERMLQEQLAVAEAGWRSAGISIQRALRRTTDHTLLAKYYGRLLRHSTCHRNLHAYSTVKATLALRQKEYMELLDAHSSLKKSLASSEASVARLSQQYDSVACDLKAEKESVTKLEAFEGEATALRRECDQLWQQSERYKEELHTLTQQMGSKERALSDVTSALHAHRDHLVTSQTREEALLRELGSVRHDLEQQSQYASRLKDLAADSLQLPVRRDALRRHYTKLCGFMQRRRRAARAAMLAGQNTRVFLRRVYTDVARYARDARVARRRGRLATGAAAASQLLFRYYCVWKTWRAVLATARDSSAREEAAQIELLTLAHRRAVDQNVADTLRTRNEELEASIVRYADEVAAEEAKRIRLEKQLETAHAKVQRAEDEVYAMSLKQHSGSGTASVRRRRFKAGRADSLLAATRTVLTRRYFGTMLCYVYWRWHSARVRQVTELEKQLKNSAEEHKACAARLQSVEEELEKRDYEQKLSVTSQTSTAATVRKARSAARVGVLAESVRRTAMRRVYRTLQMYVVLQHERAAARSTAGAAAATTETIAGVARRRRAACARHLLAATQRRLSLRYFAALRAWALRRPRRQQRVKAAAALLAGVHRHTLMRCWNTFVAARAARRLRNTRIRAAGAMWTHAQRQAAGAAFTTLRVYCRHNCALRVVHGAEASQRRQQRLHATSAGALRQRNEQHLLRSRFRVWAWRVATVRVGAARAAAGAAESRTEQLASALADLKLLRVHALAAAAQAALLRTRYSTWRRWVRVRRSGSAAGQVEAVRSRLVDAEDRCRSLTETLAVVQKAREDALYELRLVQSADASQRRRLAHGDRERRAAQLLSSTTLRCCRRVWWALSVYPTLRQRQRDAAAANTAAAAAGACEKRRRTAAATTLGRAVARGVLRRYYLAWRAWHSPRSTCVRLRRNAAVHLRAATTRVLLSRYYTRLAQVLHAAARRKALVVRVDELRLKNTVKTLACVYNMLLANVAVVRAEQRGDNVSEENRSIRRSLAVQEERRRCAAEAGVTQMRARAAAGVRRRYYARLLQYVWRRRVLGIRGAAAGRQGAGVWVDVQRRYLGRWVRWCERRRTAAAREACGRRGGEAAGLSARVVALEAEVAGTRADQRAMEEAMQESQLRCEDLEGRVEELAGEARGLHKALDRERVSVNLLKAERDRQGDAIARLEGQKAQLDRCARNHADVERELRAAIAALTDGKALLTAELEETNGRRATSTKLIIDKEVEIVNLKREVERLTAVEVAHVNTEVDLKTARAALERAEGEKTALAAEVDEVTKQLASTAESLQRTRYDFQLRADDDRHDWAQRVLRAKSAATRALAATQNRVHLRRGWLALLYRWSLRHIRAGGRSERAAARSRAVTALARAADTNLRRRAFHQLHGLCVLRAHGRALAAAAQAAGDRCAAAAATAACLLHTRKEATAAALAAGAAQKQRARCYHAWRHWALRRVRVGSLVQRASLVSRRVDFARCRRGWDALAARHRQRRGARRNAVGAATLVQTVQRPLVEKMFFRLLRFAQRAGQRRAAEAAGTAAAEAYTELAESTALAAGELQAKLVAEQTESNALRGRLEEVETTVRAQKQELMGMLDAKVVQETRALAAEDEVTRLTTQLAEKEEAETALNARLSRYQRGYEKSKEEYQGTIDGCQQDIVARERELEAKEAAMQQLRGEMGDLVRQIEARDAVIAERDESLEEAAAEAVEAAETRREERHALQLEVSARDATIVEKDDEIARLAEEGNELRQEVRAAHKRYKVTADRLAAKEYECRRLGADFQKSVDDTKAIAESIESALEQTAQQTAVMEGEAQDLRDRNEDLCRLLHAKVDESEFKTNRVAFLTGRVNELESKAREAAEELQGAKLETGKLAASLEVLEKRYADTQEEVAALRDKTATLTAEVTERTDALEKAVTQADLADIAEKKATRRCTMLSGELADARAALTQAQDDARLREAALEKELHDVRKQLIRREQNDNVAQSAKASDIRLLASALQDELMECGDDDGERVQELEEEVEVLKRENARLVRRLSDGKDLVPSLALSASGVVGGTAAAREKDSESPASPESPPPYSPMGSNTTSKHFGAGGSPAFSPRASPVPEIAHGGADVAMRDD